MTHKIQIKKNFWKITMVLMTLIITAACTPTGGIEPNAQLGQTTIYIGSETADCVGVAPQTCLLVKFEKDAEWELFYDNITGFLYEPGFEYELLVTKTEVENPPADASSVQYELIEVVNKTAVDNTVSLANPASVYCQEQGGELDIRTDEEGNQVGICVFDDGSECEEWAFYRGECQPSQADSLVGTDWNLVTYNEQTPLAGFAPTIRFTESEINGSTGCNSYFGSYTLIGTSISIEGLGQTEMACEGLMEQESIFLQMLQATESITLDSGILTINTAQGNLVFKSKEEMTLVGTDWNLVTYGDQTPLSDAVPTIQFTEGEINGSTGCNRYFGGYTLNGASISVGNLGSTMMACEGLMDQEVAFLQMLQTAESFTLGENMLTIHTPQGELVFTIKEDLSLEDTHWTLNGIVQGEAIVSTIHDSEITAEFSEGQISGSAGCNNYFASYEREDTSLTLGLIGSTQMMCEDEKNQREMEFLTALEGVAGFSISRDILTLTDAQGATLVIFQAQEIIK